jgi:hypothetical protein
MLKPKTRQERASHWNSLSDNDLLDAELTTDSPDQLEGLVFHVPEGAEEPYVEFKYDLRKTEHEKLRCCHCNQPHLAGFVMNKLGQRFLVGHICGEHIYAENFSHYTNDYDMAVERRDTLRRVRDARAVIEPFSAWLKEFSESNVFDLYHRIQDQFDERMEWLSKQLKWHTNNGGCAIEGHKLPKTFFDGYTDPHGEFIDIAPAIMSDALLLVGKMEIHKDMRITFGRLQAKLSRLEMVIKQLREPLDFFQPATLTHVCAWATEHDNPNKRRYKAAMMSLTCHRDKTMVSVQIPRGYKVPSLETLQKFRAALAGFDLG